MLLPRELFLLTLLYIPCTVTLETNHGRQQAVLTVDATNDDRYQFELKHIIHHGTLKFPDLHRRLDILPEVQLWRAHDDQRVAQSSPTYLAKSRKRTTRRREETEVENFRNKMENHVTKPGWAEVEEEEPDITDKSTVLAFARMANDAYYLEPGDAEWQDVRGGFNHTEDFGWESDGLRGHVFVDTTNKTAVIAMKGTSLPFVDPAGTISNDKLNDNLLFSCCCGQGGRYLWHQVCDCQTGEHTANATCLADEIREKTRYYHAAQELYHNVTELYPEANIWLAGHSLGGSIASLVALKFNHPAVTFEAPADAMAALRLGLPTPPKFRLGNSTAEESVDTPPEGAIYHFGHTADDIFMGNCNALTSICTVGGYAMESKCHTGAICTYDTVKDKNWTPNARSYHGIALVISDVIEAYEKLPECKAQADCRDCEEWSFFHSS